MEYAQWDEEGDCDMRGWRLGNAPYERQSAIRNGGASGLVVRNQSKATSPGSARMQDGRRVAGGSGWMDGLSRAENRPVDHRKEPWGDEEPDESMNKAMQYARVAVGSQIGETPPPPRQLPQCGD